MKKLILFTGLIGMLFYTPVCFPQPNPKAKTIKYDNGDKYTGETQIKKNTKSKKIRIKSGQGILYYKNGNIFEGVFVSDDPYMGTLRYANGNIFEGTFVSDAPNKGTLRYANGNVFEGDFISGKPRSGTLTFKTEGAINIGADEWLYPSNSHFIGDIQYWTGKFDCFIKNYNGDIYNGNLRNKKLYNGQIDYANGDSFTGSFYTSHTACSPKEGKYKYASTTNIKGWEIPKGCTFTGNVAQFTGEVDKELVDAKGNKFFGKFKSGQPDEGTMTDGVTGNKETGKWVNGMSPRIYAQHQLLIKHQQDSIDNAHAKLEREKFEQYLDDCKEFKSSMHKNLISGAVLKLAQLFAGKKIIYDGETYLCDTVYLHREQHPVIVYSKNNVTIELNVVKINKKRLPYLKDLKCETPEIEEAKSQYIVCDVELDDDHNWTRQLCLASDITKGYKQVKDYYIRKFGYSYGTAVVNGKVEKGMTVEMIQAIHGKGRISKQTIWGQEITVLEYGGGLYSILGAVLTDDSKTFTFINGRLKEYGSEEGKVIAL